MRGVYTTSNPKRINLDDVSSLTLADYGLTRENVDLQMLGIHVEDKVTKQTLPEEFYIKSIKAQLARIEKELDIKVIPRLVNEEYDLDPAQLANSGNILLRSRPVLQVEQVRSNSLMGQGEITYNQSQYKVSCLGGNLYIQQSEASNMLQSQMAYGLNMTPYGGYGTSHFNQQSIIAGSSGFGGQRSIPFAINVSYIAGMLPPEREGVEYDWEFGEDLQSCILKAASCQVFEQWGRLILPPGIESRSITMDAVAEAIGTTQSAMYGGAYADIRQLEEDIDKMIQAMKGKYANRASII